ncbi:ABC transporter ATP-binding protein [Aliikangiella sp. IMCC44359]|uniref:ABC transporter ATP-binding protein n=1 Tax=Aliikangiella sp. IMCC44359 TaxID=3459125 RepID=UPI00403ACC7E
MQIKVTDIIKQYAKVTAVTQASFSVDNGEIVALLGPNGAGKSSIVRMLVGFTHPDSGSIEISHQAQITASIPKEFLGYLPEDRGLFLDRTLQDNLMYFAKLRGLSKNEATQKINYWLERFELTDRATENLKSLSKGNQQKIQLISAVLHDPKVAILDEPFSGLDPINQEFVVEIIKEFRDAGMTILLSAHQMNLVERLADRVVLMNLGKVVSQGSLTEIHNQLSDGKKLLVRFSDEIEASRLSSLSCVSAYEIRQNNEYDLTTSEEYSLNQVIDEVRTLGEILDIKSEHLSLHDLYLKAIKQANSETPEKIS